jgi:putative peptidoglycan lipid II flippase
VRKYLYEISRKKLTVGSAAAILALTSLGSNILGLYRERIIASMFGTNHFAEIYGASFRLPDLIFNILILGALSAAFIPIFIEKICEKDEDSAWELANSFLNLMLVVAITAAIIVAIFAPYLVPLLVPGFKGRPVPGLEVDMLGLTVNMTRLLLLSPIFMCISGVFSGILNSYKRFLAYALAPLIYNIAIILSALFIAENIVIPVYGLGIGVILGSFFHAAIQFPAVRDAGFRYRPILNLKDASLKKIILLMWPRVLTIGSTQINLLVDTIMASYLVGGIAVLRYADNIQTLPTVIFGIAIATAAFPYLSEALSNKNHNEFKRAFTWSLNKILYFMVPASVGIIVLRAQIVRLALGIGNFGWESTQMTAYVLGVFGFGLVAQGLIPLLTRTFYVLQDTKTPLKVALIGMLVNAFGTIILPGVEVNLLGFNRLGIGGIALAFVLAGFVNATLLWFLLSKRIKGLFNKEIILSSLKILFSSLSMGAIAWLSLRWFDFFVQASGGVIAKGLLPQTLSTIAVSCFAYFCLTYLLGMREPREMLEKFKKIITTS